MVGITFDGTTLTTANKHRLDFYQQANLPSIYPLCEDKLFKDTSPKSSPTDTSDSLLTPVFQKHNVHMGGSSVGRGFRRAARYYLHNHGPRRAMELAHEYVSSESKNQLDDGDRLLEPDVGPRVEEPFYVCDLGIIVAQFYQWKRLLPRVKPYYAMKCNPDKVIVKTLAALGADFDCASRQEIRVVQEVSQEVGKSPNIIFANPCKPRAHLIEAVYRGVRLVTFDNVSEVEKCASVSKRIQLVLRIVTDDSGSQCRLSSKFGAPKGRWRPLLAAAKKHGLEVVGVSFHVGSGCRDFAKYELALRDARTLFDLAEKEFGFKMTLLDIGGGFPGETHSLWNPADRDPIPSEAEADNEDEEEAPDAPNYSFFKDIALEVGSLIDEIFPESSGVEVIAEPGRYLVAASHTLVCSVTSVRENALDEKFTPEPIPDDVAAMSLHRLTRDEEKEIVEGQGNPENAVIDTIVEELASYSKMYAIQNLVQQEIDVYADRAENALLDAPPPNDVARPEQYHTAEGVSVGIVAESLPEEKRPRSMSVDEEPTATLTIAAAGEAAVSGVVFQAVADSAPLQDDYAYYVNDGVYGAFNNLMFDHASVRPRVLKSQLSKAHKVVSNNDDDVHIVYSDGEEDGDVPKSKNLYASTVFGPTCDSIDVICRSVLLPKLSIGDWVYFQNMGAYTCAAASDFNGFQPTEKFYVCSVLPEEYERKVMKNGKDEELRDEKKSE